MYYKQQFITIVKLCELLKASEPAQFLKEASLCLAAITELPHGDEALRESGVVRPISLLLQVGGDESVMAACNIINGICEKEQKVNESEANRTTPDFINLNVSRDLVMVIPMIVKTLNDMMWSYRTQKGEVCPADINAVKQWEDACVQAKQMYQPMPEKPNRAKWPKVPIEPTVDSETAKLQDYKTVISSLMRALADIVACNEAKY